MRLWRDFKNFAMRGSVLDLAVGVITGVAFGNVVNSLVKDIIMPPIGLLLGRVDFSNLYISLNGQSYHSLVATQAAGAPTINYGVFINTVINFLIIALAVFLMISQFNRLMPPAKANTKNCPYCEETISLRASRCPHCTSDLQ